MFTFCVVAPFDQRNAFPALADKITLSPRQKVVAEAGVMLAEGALTAMVTRADMAVQLSALVTVTV